MIMRRITFDLDVLRTFVTGVDLGSFAKAADRLGRSTSAVSAQLKKLEEQLGMAVLRKEGRGMAVTPGGEALLGYARRLLDLNDEAATAVRGVELAGTVRLGMQEDFGEHVLTEVLGRFARAHPQIKIEAQVARNASLIEQVAAGRLDLALAWDTGSSPARHAQLVARLPMQWLAGAQDVADGGAVSRFATPLPLVMLDSPCLMRAAAIDALDRAGIPWRIAFTSHSLSGVWAAVAAGLGVTVRTKAGAPASVRPLASPVLPPLPVIGLSLLQSEAELTPTMRRLRDIVLQALAPYTQDHKDVQYSA
jgi:DNA-binding transcriptional LysR family regulator